MNSLTFSPQEKFILERIRDVAAEQGIACFLAGGMIRDKILGKENHDIDITCSKDSEKLAYELASKYNLPNPVKLDKSGAIMVDFNGTFCDLIDMEKIYSPVVEPVDQNEVPIITLELSDTYRRDLTINSLLYNLHTGELLDLTGKGLSDIKNGIIRTVIDPIIKYRAQSEDILRGVRFYATNPNFVFAEGMLDAFKSNSQYLESRRQGGQVSGRKIERELRKMAKTPESWNRAKGVLVTAGIDKFIKHEMDSVESDFQNVLKPIDKISGENMKKLFKFAAERREKEQIGPNELEMRVIDLWLNQNTVPSTIAHKLKISVSDVLKILDNNEELWVRQLSETKRACLKLRLKTAQVNQNFIDSPNVKIDPALQGSIKDAVEDLKKINPNIFVGVLDIVVGSEALGSVSNKNPTTINLNLNKIKQEVQKSMPRELKPGSAEYKKALEDAIKRQVELTIEHEKAHISTYDKVTNTFKGGEIPAEQAEKALLTKLK